MSIAAQAPDIMASSTRNDRYLNTDHIVSNLKQRTVRGSALTVASHTIAGVLRAGSMIILARMLTPGDFGLVAMPALITGFVGMFKDLGLSMSTIQRAEITQAQVSTLFWVNVAAGAIITLVTSAMAPAIAWFFGEPSLISITLVSSLGFLLGGFTVQHQALLKRQMKFASLAALEVFSMVFSMAVAILAAHWGAGYWSLVYMSVAMPLATMIGSWVLCGWRPGMPVRRAGIRSMIAFGGNYTGFSFLNYFARNLDNILIGWRWGTVQLGLYTRAYGFLMLPISQINVPLMTVAMPVLSRLHQKPDQYRRFYLKMLSILTFITMPTSLFLFIASNDLVLLLLGSQWTQASRIFGILGLSVMAQSIYNTQGWIHMSIGRADRMLKFGVLSSIAFVISFFIGLPWGAIGVAVCYTIVFYIIFIPCMWYAGQPIGLTLPLMASVVWRPFLASVGGALLAGLALWAIGSSAGYFVRLAISGSIMFCAYMGFTIMLNQGMGPIREFLDMVHEIVAKKKSPSTI